jgi:hypothetical protein
VKSPDKYVGKGYHLWACITQFDAATGADTFRADASNKKEEYWSLDGDNSLFNGDENRLSAFVTDDIVVMNVTALGSYSYDTQIGGIQPCRSSRSTRSVARAPASRVSPRRRRSTRSYDIEIAFTAAIVAALYKLGHASRRIARCSAIHAEPIVQ